MSYIVEYSGEFYKLCNDGRVIDVYDVETRRRSNSVSADVIASWGYVHGLIKSLPNFYAVPEKDSILVEYDDYTSYLHMNVIVDVGTVRTTMRRRVAALVESIERLKNDLLMLISEYDVSIAGRLNGVAISFKVRNRYIEKVTLKIDRMTGSYTSDGLLHELQRPDVKHRGICLIDAEARRVLFTYSGVRWEDGPSTSSYITALAAEWGDVTGFLSSAGFVKELNDDQHRLTYSKDDLTIVFFVDRTSDVPRMCCVIGRCNHFCLTGHGDADTLSKCVATAETLQSYIEDHSRMRSLGWSCEKDTPWKVTLKNTRDDTAVAVIDAGVLSSR